MTTTLAISKSTLSGGSNRVRAYEERLKEMDKNGDGQLSIEEIADFLDDVVRKEKTARTMKWVIISLTAFSLLTIASIVGLTYAIVSLTKDTQVTNDVYVSKDSGAPLQTAVHLTPQNSSALSSSLSSSTNPSLDLAKLTSIKIPSFGGDEVFTIYKIAAATLLSNGSVLFKTIGGDSFIMGADQLPGAASDSNATDISATTTNGTGTTVANGNRRRLFLIGGSGSGIPVSVVISDILTINAYDANGNSFLPTSAVADVKTSIATNGGPAASIGYTMTTDTGTTVTNPQKKLNQVGCDRGCTFTIVWNSVTIFRACPAGQMCMSVLQYAKVLDGQTVGDLKKAITAVTSVPVAEQILLNANGVQLTNDAQDLKAAGVLGVANPSITLELQGVVY